MSREKDQKETLTKQADAGAHRFPIGGKRLIVAGLVVLLLAVGTVLGLWFKNYWTSTSKKATTKTDSELALVSKYVMENNISQALAHAKKALIKTPDDLNAIQAVASLTEKSNPDEAKRYYVQALEVFKKQNNPDADGKTAITYWAAAGLAEKAGYKDQAKQYYQKVINAAKPSDSYEQSLVKRSQAALKALQ